MEDKDRIVIEPEIVDEKKRTKNSASFENMSGFAKEFAEDEIKGIKNKIILQVFLYLFFIGLIFILIVWGLVTLLSFIIPPIFAIFIVAGIIFILGYPIFWTIKKIQGK